MFNESVPLPSYALLSSSHAGQVQLVRTAYPSVAPSLSATVYRYAATGPVTTRPRPALAGSNTHQKSGGVSSACLAQGWLMGTSKHVVGTATGGKVLGGSSGALRPTPCEGAHRCETRLSVFLMEVHLSSPLTEASCRTRMACPPRMRHAAWLYHPLAQQTRGDSLCHGAPGYRKG
jgi:hypothetical protein